MSEDNQSPTVSEVKWQTNWEKCCLCQEDKRESLKCPSNTSNTEHDGYKNIATNVPLFHELNALPIPLDPKRLDDGSGIETTLRQKNAKYHQSCRMMFNNSKLGRAQKRAMSHKPEEAEAGPSKCTRRSISSITEKDYVCFFCEKEVAKADREAMTKNIYERLNECATLLQDTKLLAKLSAGDLVAQEVKYHLICLTSVYNRERSVLRQQRQGEQSQHDRQAYDRAFAELVTYIIEMQRSSEGGNVFKLSDLTDLMTKRMEQLGLKEPQIHSTRLKEQLLDRLPELQAHKTGRHILLAFKDDIGPALSKAFELTDVSRTAQLVRNDILESKTNFDGYFEENCQETSVPPSLIELVSMIEHGPDIQSQIENEATMADLAVAQIIHYNCHQSQRRRAATYKHYSKDRETPFVIYVGLLLYAKTRKRQLIDTLHRYGICISYDRVLEISSQMGTVLVQRFIEEGVVCPTVLRKGLFTTGALDNIDHNPSSTTAKSSFHGTGISLFQHPTNTEGGEQRELLHIAGTPATKKVPPLPESYTNVRPAYFKDAAPVPTGSLNVLPLKPEILFQNIKMEYEWLEHVNVTENVEGGVSVTWAAHHASKLRGLQFRPCISALLPLLPEQAHSVATVKHAMSKIKEATQYLNPDQIPVVTADQPLFAIAKQIQWQWPELYGEDKFIIMFGGLHIEMAAFKAIGGLLKDSGWTTALTEAGIASSGTAESFLTASSVAKTRLAHQVTACALFKLLQRAYAQYQSDNAGTDSATDSLESWRTKNEEQHPLFQFWSQILTFELLILVFIRSIRETNFDLYRESLSELVPFFFALDHTNYSRWLPVHLRDMALIERNHPQMALAFKNGHFAIHKTERRFSAIAIDQAHEQNNKVIKGDGGAVGLTEDPSALRRWMVSGPEISRLIEQFECEYDPVRADVRHHEDTEASQTSFLANVKQMVTTLDELGSPFMEDTKDLIVLDSKEIVDIKISESHKHLLKLGREQYKGFTKVLSDGKASFYDPLKRNKLPIFSRKPTTDGSTSKSKLLSIKDDCKLFSRLFISCQSRQCDLNEFFMHENQNAPPSLSQNGCLNTGTKSDLMDILQTGIALPDAEPNADAIIIDGAALINQKSPGAARTFDDYATEVVLPVLHSYSRKYHRTDLVFDIYKSDSLKSSTREKRGAGIRRKVVGSSRVPSNWHNFLRQDDNKTELFTFLATHIERTETTNTVIVTKGEDVVSNTDIDKHELSPCTHEEADTRLFIHAKDASKKGNKKIIISSTDTDVVVIAVAYFSDLEIEKLWIAFGKGKDFRWIPIHELCMSLGPRAKALPFFHAFTGCDTVSAFRGKGKKSAWQAWNVFEEATEVFRRLSNMPESISEDDMLALEQFVVICYDRSSTEKQVNEARLDMFARKQKSYEVIPPTQSALIEHTKRAAHQAGHVWGQTLICEPVIPTPTVWGWRKDAQQCWQPHWTSLPAIAACCQELAKCGCKKRSCSGNCKCFKSGLTCSALCSCTCQID